MANNSSNTNKTTSNHNSLNKQKLQRHMTLEIQVLAWDMHKNVAARNWKARL